MNTKTKLMLGLSALTAGTLAAGATGTFAWFTTNKSAKATYSKITASSARGDLHIEMNGISEAATNSVKNYSYDENTGVTSYKDISITGNTKSGITDISSADGLTFKKPNWVSASGNNEKVDTNKPFLDATSGTDYTKFWIKVTNSGNAKSNIFLDANTNIAATTSDSDDQSAKNTALASWTRLAVVVANDDSATPTDQSEGTLAWLVENAGDTGSNYSKYVSDSDASTGSLTLTDLEGENSPAKGKHVVVGGTDTKKFTQIIDTTKKTETGYLFTLGQGESKYLICSVWCEGTENDNQNTAIGGSIDAVLSFTANQAND